MRISALTSFSRNLQVTCSHGPCCGLQPELAAFSSLVVEPIGLQPIVV